MVVYLNKENSFNNDYKVTFYTIFLIAKLARLATLNSLPSLSLATLNSLSSLQLLETHSVLSGFSTLTLFFLVRTKFVIPTHKRIRILNILNARPGGLVTNNPKSQA